MMRFLYTHAVTNFFYFIITIIFQLGYAGICYGFNGCCSERSKIYEQLLNDISHINEKAQDNAIVLHGSLAWSYNLINTNETLALKNMTTNDMDFFIKDEYFDTSIIILKEKFPQLSFRTSTIKSDNTIWCACYMKDDNNKVFRIADFVKYNKEFSVEDVLLAKTENFSITIAKARWMIEYEKLWINNLVSKIIFYNSTIKNEKNNWLALSENSDIIYSIYKTFNKYNHHLDIFKIINKDNNIPFNSELLPETNKAKTDLDITISEINPLLTKEWKINIQEECEKNSQNTTHQDKRLSYAEITSKTPAVNTNNRNFNNIKTNQKPKKRSTTWKNKTETHKKYNDTSNRPHCKDATRKTFCQNKLNTAEKHFPKDENKHSQNKKQPDSENNNLLQLTNRFDCIFLRDETQQTPDADLMIDEANPFTYSYKEQIFTRNGHIKNSIYCTWEEDNIVDHKNYIKYIGVLVMFTLYFYHEVPIETAQEIVEKMVYSAIELLTASVDFILNSDYNWMISWPAAFTLLAMKFKRKKTKQIKMLALGLLSTYSCIYTYKFVNNQFSKRITTPCLLPNWLSQIEYIPEYEIINPLTWKEERGHNSFAISKNKISPNQLSCENIIHLENSLISSVSFIDRILTLEACGLIKEQKLSEICYTTDWTTKSELDLIYETEGKRCENKDLCISVRHFIGKIQDDDIAGFAICCIDNHGKCTIPDGYKNYDAAKKGKYLLDVRDHKNMNLSLQRFLPNNDGGVWQSIINSLEGGILYNIKKLPKTGVYMIYNNKKTKAIAYICMIKGKTDIYELPRLPQ